MKKIISFVLTAAICLSFITVIPKASAYSSAEDANESAAILQMMGAMQGDGSGSLDLSGTLTRAQFCKIAVVTMGLSAKVSQYSGYTIFPDVPATSWEAGYVNLAVRNAGIMSGYPSGYFGPEDVITYGQAVTVLMRVLGYKSTDVGAKWPDDYISKAGEVGLTDGVSSYGNSIITRGEAAVLFANMLSCKVNGSAKTYASTISGVTTVENVFLVSGNATTDSGQTGAVKIAGASSGTYLKVNSVPSALVGKFGTLVLNSAGKALTFIPAADGTTITSTVTDTTASYISCSNGTKISMTSSPTFYMDGQKADYSSKWYNIEKGMSVSAYYSDGGTVQYVLVASSGSDSDITAIATSNGYTFPSSAKIYKNGYEVTSSDVCPYDVISYVSSSQVYNVSDKKISGRYDDAYPNDDTPSTVTVLGAEFEVLDSAVSSLSKFSVGDNVTLLLTADNKVAGAVSTSTLSAANIGIVTSASSSKVTLKLVNGITVSGKINDTSAANYKNMLFSVSSSGEGYVSLANLTEKSVSSTLNLSDKTLGSARLSPSVKIIDWIVDGNAAEVDIDDITAKTISGSKIYYASYDAANNVTLIVLRDVTGDAYRYGYIDIGSKTTSSGGFSVTNETVTLTNSDGSSTVLGNSDLYSGIYAGISLNKSGNLGSYVKLTKATGIGRSDFTEDVYGNFYVNINGTTIPVSDDVQVYVESIDSWTTLASARSRSDSLTVYYDADKGCKVRVVIAD